MSSWANPIVARLAVKDLAAGEYCGLVLVCSWPMPDSVQAAYAAFAEKLTRAMPSAAYVYPSTSLHCTLRWR